jgi:hypothetical protein
MAVIENSRRGLHEGQNYNERGSGRRKEVRRFERKIQYRFVEDKNNVTVGVIIPTLGDRKKFLHFCLERLKKQTRQPDLVEVVDYKNESGDIDVTQRYRHGIKKLIKEGAELIVFIEDDDYYPLTYIAETVKLWRKSGRPAVMGCNMSVYYHLPTRQYREIPSRHSSAYCTSVSKQAKLEVCDDNEAYFDLYLWRGNRHHSKQVEYKNKPIGIKHGTGRCGGAGHIPRSGYYPSKDYDLNYLSEHVDEEALSFYKKLFTFKPFVEVKKKTDRSNDVVNIITRTFKREKMFRVCEGSVKRQTHKNINHIVGSEEEYSYVDNCYRLSPKDMSGSKPRRAYAAPYNLHLNEMAEHVKEGWVMYLDDDDVFLQDDAVETALENVENEDDLLIWRVDINGEIIPSDENFGKDVVVCDISGIGFMFHSKHLPVDWGCWSLGDYRVVSSLEKKLNVKWIDRVLTGTQGKPNRGRRVS